MNIVTYFKRRFCKHEIFIDDIRRLSPDQVIAPCNRCGKPMRAPYGLALHAKLTQKPKDHP